MTSTLSFTLLCFITLTISLLSLSLSLSFTHCLACLTRMSSQGASTTERLIAASRQNNIELLNEAIKEAGTDLDVNARDGAGNTALIYAAEFGATACLTALLQVPGVSIELRDLLQRETALLHSCKSTHITDVTRKECVAALLQARANPSVRDGSGRLPEELVDNEEIKQMLRQARMTQRLGAADIVDDDDDDDDSDSEGEASD
ncbi:hypothetical protein BDF22DRAFT_689480 [Syncephalis plumigaleata]|nr:hypothetical protein BDF22DRAFT_689480 [Syncephalis plumigaleata]